MLRLDMLRAFSLSIFLASLVLAAFACPNNAPAAAPGKLAGEACASDLECDAGLRCECSLCALPTAIDRPPFCEADFSALCEDEVSCYESCEALNVVGEADCQSGVPLCDEGVLFETCPPGSCLGEAQPGEICVDGEFICELGRSTLGPCYTNDCESAPIECVTDCSADVFFRSLCIAAEQVCEGGLAREDCGGCLGAAPSCVDSCDNFTPVVDSICQNDAFTCSFAVGTVVADDCFCGDASLVVRNEQDLNAIDEGCILESLIIEYESEDLVIDQVVNVQDLTVIGGNLRSLSLPNLRRVNGTFEITTTLLSSLELPSLEFVGEVSALSNPLLPECQLFETFEALTENIRVIDNGECRDGGPLGDVDSAVDVQEQFDGGVRD